MRVWEIRSNTYIHMWSRWRHPRHNRHNCHECQERPGPGFIIDWRGAGFLIFAGTGRHWAMSGRCHMVIITKYSPSRRAGPGQPIRGRSVEAVTNQKPRRGDTKTSDGTSLMSGSHPCPRTSGSQVHQGVPGKLWWKYAIYDWLTKLKLNVLKC